MKLANLSQENKKKCNFLSYSKYYLGLIVAILISAIVVVSCLGFSKGFDYNGGTIFTVVYDGVDQTENFNEAENKFEEILDKYDIQSVSYQYEDTSFGKALVVKTLNKDEAKNAEVIADAFAEFGYDNEDLVEKNYVSSNIVSASETNATKMAAVALSVVLVVISVYVLFRFNLKTALVYLASALIDILVVIAMTIICRIQINVSICYAVIFAFVLSSITKLVFFKELQSNLNDENLKDLSMPCAINLSLKNILFVCIGITLTSVLGLALFAGLGSMQVKAFALPALIGTIFALLTTYFVSSSFYNWFKIDSKRK